MSPLVMPSSGHHTLFTFEITTPPIVAPSVTCVLPRWLLRRERSQIRAAIAACDHRTSVRSEEISLASAPVVHRHGLDDPSRDPSAEWRPYGPLAGEAEPMGDDAPQHDRSPFRQSAQRDPRLLRRRPKSRDPGDEWVGKGRTRLVAQPSGASRRRGGATRWLARHSWPRGPGRRAGASLGSMAHDGRRCRRLRDPPSVRDRGRCPRAAASFRGRLTPAAFDLGVAPPEAFQGARAEVAFVAPAGLTRCGMDGARRSPRSYRLASRGGTRGHYSPLLDRNR